MKKLVIALSVVTILSSVVLIYMLSLYNNTKENKTKLQQDSNTLIGNIDNTSKMNETSKIELENLKEANQEKLMELEIWKQMIENLEQAL